MRRRRFLQLRRTKAIFSELSNLGKDIRLAEPYNIINMCGGRTHGTPHSAKKGNARGSSERPRQRKPTFAADSAEFNRYFFED